MENDGAVRVHSASEVRLWVENPLPVPLTECRFHLEGVGVTLTREIACADTYPGRRANVAVTVRPWKPGTRQLLASFASAKLSDVHGQLQVQVLP